MTTKWVRIESSLPNTWYMLSNHGDIYREKKVLVDKAGNIRGNDKTRKTFEQIRKYKVKKRFNKETGYYTVCISLNGSCKEIALHRLVAEYFVPKPKSTLKLYVDFIDRDRTNVDASNLRWVESTHLWWVEAQRVEHIKEPGVEEHIKIFKVPDWCVLYAKYNQYLDNRRKTSEIVLGFMRENGLFCGLVKTGWDEKIVEKKGECEVEKFPYFMISDKDPDVLKHDLDKLGTSARARQGDYYPIRKNSDIMRKWVNTLKAHDNFQILDVPSISDYIVLREGKTYKRMKDMYSRAFAKEGDALYLRVQSQHPFDVSDELIEVQGKEYLFNE